MHRRADCNAHTRPKPVSNPCADGCAYWCTVPRADRTSDTIPLAYADTSTNDAHAEFFAHTLSDGLPYSGADAQPLAWPDCRPNREPVFVADTFANKGAFT